MLDEIFVFHRGSGLTPATPALGLIGIQRLSLRVTLMRDGYYQIFFVDQIFIGQIQLTADNIRTPLIAVGFSNFFQLATHH